jgi:glutamate/tyrosine decarboxylase-like PLP-dependent enzyme
MFDAVRAQPQLEAFTCELSIVTFRYLPDDLRDASPETADYLNRLNEEILSVLQLEGEVFLSNATIDGKFLLRACIVNFRTTSNDVRAVADIVSRVGARVDQKLRQV